MTQWLIPPLAGLCQLSYWGIKHSKKNYTNSCLPDDPVVNPAFGGTLPTELLGIIGTRLKDYTVSCHPVDPVVNPPATDSAC